MKSLVFIVVSIYFKKWYEKERAKWYPVMVAQRIEQQAMRVNIRTKPGFQSGLPESFS